MSTPCLQRVEGELDVARVERGAPLVLAHHGRKVLEGRLPQDLVRLLLQDLLDDLLLCLKNKDVKLMMHHRLFHCILYLHLNLND